MLIDAPVGIAPRAVATSLAEASASFIRGAEHTVAVLTAAARASVDAARGEADAIAYAQLSLRAWAAGRRAVAARGRGVGREAAQRLIAAAAATATRVDLLHARVASGIAPVVLTSHAVGAGLSVRAAARRLVAADARRARAATVGTRARTTDHGVDANRRILQRVVRIARVGSRVDVGVTVSRIDRGVLRRLRREVGRQARTTSACDERDRDRGRDQRASQEPDPRAHAQSLSPLPLSAPPSPSLPRSPCFFAMSCKCFRSIFASRAAALTLLWWRPRSHFT